MLIECWGIEWHPTYVATILKALKTKIQTVLLFYLFWGFCFIEFLILLFLLFLIYEILSIKERNSSFNTQTDSIRAKKKQHERTSLSFYSHCNWTTICVRRRRTLPNFVGLLWTLEKALNIEHRVLADVLVKNFVAAAVFTSWYVRHTMRFSDGLVCHSIPVNN